MFLTLPKRALALLAASLGAAALAGCEDTGVSNRGAVPIPPETLALMEQAGVSKDAPTLIRAYKKEAELEVWKMKPDGRYAKLKTYPMCRWSGQLGPKTREGDRQVPEGFYAIAPGQLNPNSSYYLSFNVGYPNAYDRAHGSTGGTIMVHGACSSAGCFSMTDRQIAEIYAIVRTSLSNGQHAVQMQSYPFRMTAENLAKHRLDPHLAFWRQLKEGSDHFETTLKEPSVGVCGRRYVFNAQSDNGRELDPEAACPPLTVDRQIASLVAEKQRQDETRIAELSKDVPAVKLVYRDGGQHPSFTAKVADVGSPEALVPPTEIALEEKKPAPGKKGAREASGDAKAKAKAEQDADAGSARGWTALHAQSDPRPTGTITR